MTHAALDRAPVLISPNLVVMLVCYVINIAFGLARYLHVFNQK